MSLREELAEAEGKDSELHLAERVIQHSPEPNTLRAKQEAAALLPRQEMAVPGPCQATTLISSQVHGTLPRAKADKEGALDCLV